jgi:cytochrome c-type biogenesis protein CcmE
MERLNCVHCGQLLENDCNCKEVLARMLEEYHETEQQYQDRVKNEQRQWNNDNPSIEDLIGGI